MSVVAKPRTTPRPDRVAVKTALLSVSDKAGLLDFAKGLAASGVKILSTGGTAKTLREAGLDVTDVSDHTGFPEIMDGRVKTLHPKIHGGLLARRDDADHLSAMTTQGIEGIDLLVVNLYPFRETVAKGGDYDNCVENIDIGGPAMVRASAKNHNRVSIIVDPADYPVVLDQLKAGQTLEQRRALAGKALLHCIEHIGVLPPSDLLDGLVRAPGFEFAGSASVPVTVANIVGIRSTCGALWRLR